MTNHKQGQKRRGKREYNNGKRGKTCAVKLFRNHAGRDTQSAERIYGNPLRFCCLIFHRAEHLKRTDQPKRVQQPVKIKISVRQKDLETEKCRQQQDVTRPRYQSYFHNALLVENRSRKTAPARISFKKGRGNTPTSSVNAYLPLSFYNCSSVFPNRRVRRENQTIAFSRSLSEKAGNIFLEK